MTDAPTPPIGTWPADDLRRAFVAGAAWSEYTIRGATMWPSDRDRAEAEAERRYPEGKVSTIYQLEQKLATATARIARLTAQRAEKDDVIRDHRAEVERLTAELVNCRGRERPAEGRDG